MFLHRINRKTTVLFILWNGYSIQIKVFFIHPICTLSIFCTHDYNHLDVTFVTPHFSPPPPLITNHYKCLTPPLGCMTHSWTAPCHGCFRITRFIPLFVSFFWFETFIRQRFGRINFDNNFRLPRLNLVMRMIRSSRLRIVFHWWGYYILKIWANRMTCRCHQSKNSV